MLGEKQAETILAGLGLHGPIEVHEIKRANHVYRVRCGADVFFLKTYTKDWYDALEGLPGSTGQCVDHEETAWSVLREHGLSVPDVVLGAQTCANPLERPFLLTRELRGRPLTELLKTEPGVDFSPLLRAVGSYLRTMHSITFTFPGYISSTGPHKPLAPNDWQHVIFSAQRSEEAALGGWEEDDGLPAELVEELRAFLRSQRAVMEAAFQPPRFAHGDCHAHQFFLYRDDQSWRVSGVVDMEVSSAGDAETDLGKFAKEMGARFSAATRWWEPLFEGYGKEPDFDMLRLRWAGSSHITFKIFGEDVWPGTREQLLRHILRATTWAELFDTSKIEP